MMFGQKKSKANYSHRRILWMDLLNIMSCVFVVILHTTNEPVHWWNGITDTPYIWGLITHTICISAVPLFLMLSGANLLSREMSYKQFFKRRFNRVGIPFLFWSVFYWLLMHKEVDIKQFWLLFLQGKMNPHMWFFVPLFAIYLSMPFLHVFIKHATRLELEYYLLFSLVLTSFMPFLFGSLEWFFPSYIFPLANQYLFIAVLGYYLNTSEFNLKNKSVIIIYVVTAVFHFCYLYGKTQLLGHSDNLILHYETPSIIIMSTCIFVLFKRIAWKPSECSSYLISLLSGCSLGIYLAHYIFVTYIPEYMPMCKNYKWEFIIVYNVSLIAVMLIKKVPILRKCV